MITIDPGANGGLVYCDLEGNIHLCNMPDTPGDLRNLLATAMHGHEHSECVWEKTGTYMPGNSGPASVKFARSCGVVEGLLLGMQISQRQVPPHTWMKKLGALPKEKKERKNAIKAIVQQRYPHLRVSLKTSDALALYMLASEGKI